MIMVEIDNDNACDEMVKLQLVIRELLKFEDTIADCLSNSDLEADKEYDFDAHEAHCILTRFARANLVAG